MDPSEYNYPDMHKNFIKYLYNKTLHIDIWNADSQMLFGTVNLPLKYLLR
jgi:nephrocystin-4